MPHLGEDELSNQLKKAQKLVEVGGIYVHYRDSKSRYKVTGLVIIESTQSVGVTYKKETGSNALKSIAWMRPLNSWIEKIHNGEKPVSRFKKMT